MCRAAVKFTHRDGKTTRHEHAENIDACGRQYGSSVVSSRSNSAPATTGKLIAAAHHAMYSRLAMKPN
jgi:hypothetical protein